MSNSDLMRYIQNPIVNTIQLREYEIEIDEKIYNFETYSLDKIYVRGICFDVVNQRREKLRDKVVQVITIESPWKLEKRYYSISQEELGHNILVGFIRNGDVLP